MVISIIKMSISNLIVNRLRSSLTIIGVVFGTAAVIATLSSNEGAALYIQEKIKQLGTNVIAVSSHRTPLGDDVKEVLESYDPNIKAASSVRTLGDQPTVWSELAGAKANVIGVDSDYFQGMKLDFAWGRNFSNEESDAFAMVAVVGGDLGNKLFGESNYKSELLALHFGPELTFYFRLVGVLDKKGGEVGNATDGAIFIPESIAAKIGYQRDQVALLITQNDEDQSAITSSLIGAILMPAYGNGIRVTDSRESIRKTQEIWSKQNLVGIILAGISLVTGGVGIMNIMLISIAQRRKEIGIRKAVGANNASIFFQFVFEAGFVCLVGGILGVGVGVLFGQQFANLLGQWEAVVSLKPILIALGSAVTIGLVFGILPAIRAAKMDPFEALRT